MEKIYVAVYSDYDCNGYVIGAFRNNTDAEQFKELYLEELKYSDRYSEFGEYGERVEIEQVEIFDIFSIANRIENLKQKKKEVSKQREEFNKTKEEDLAEYNRIKEKYGL